jgi:outer membrane murein-binding lipoprotein Lpp
MKRLVLTLVAVVMTSIAFAGNNAAKTEEKFNLDYNVRKLGCRLDLTIEQMEAVEDAQKSFNLEVANASNSETSEEKVLSVKEAVKTNFEKMRFILNKSQFGKYEELMNKTFENNGMDEYLKI